MRTRPASAAGDGLILRFDPKRGRRGLIEDGWTQYGTPLYRTNSVEFLAGSALAYERFTSLLLRSDFSVVSVCDTPTGGSYRAICAMRATAVASTTRFQFGFNNVDRKLYVYNGTAIPTSTNAVPAGKHHNVLVVSGGNAYFYTDGVANGSTAFALTATAKTTTFTVGSSYVPVVDTCLEKPIYDVRVYNRAWTAAEVADDYREYT